MELNDKPQLIMWGGKHKMWLEYIRISLTAIDAISLRPLLLFGFLHCR